jgi:hypothetical protein
VALFFWIVQILNPLPAGDGQLSVLEIKKAGIKPAILILWGVLESNQQPLACHPPAGGLNQLS